MAAEEVLMGDGPSRPLYDPDSPYRDAWIKTAFLPTRHGLEGQGRGVSLRHSVAYAAAIKYMDVRLRTAQDPEARAPTMDEPHPVTNQPLRQQLLTVGAPFYPVNQRTSDGTYTWTDSNKVIINGVITKAASTNSTAQQATARRQPLKLFDNKKGGAGPGTGDLAPAGKGKQSAPPVQIQDPVQTWQAVCEASVCLAKLLNPDLQLEDIFPEVAAVLPGVKTVQMNGWVFMQFWAEVRMTAYLIPVFQAALTDPEGPLAVFPVPGPAGAPVKGAFRLSPFGRPRGPKGVITATMFLGGQYQGGSLPYNQIGNQILAQFGGEYLDSRVANLMAKGTVQNGDMTTAYEVAATDPDLGILDFHLSVEKNSQGWQKQVLVVPHTSQVYDDLQAVKYLKLCKGDRPLLTLHMETESASSYALAVNLRVVPDMNMKAEIMYEIGKLHYKGHQVSLAGVGDYPLGDIPPPQLVMKSSLGEEVIWQTDLLPSKQNLSLQDFPTELSELFFTGLGTPLYPESDVGLAVRGEHILVNVSTRESLLGVLMGMAGSGEQPYIVSAGGGDPKGLPLELALPAKPFAGKLWASGALCNFPAPGKSPWSPGLPAQPRTAAALLAVLQGTATEALPLPKVLPPLEDLRVALGKKMKSIHLAVVTPAQVKPVAPAIDWLSIICPAGSVQTPSGSTAVHPTAKPTVLGGPNVGDKRNHEDSDEGEDAGGGEGDGGGDGDEEP